MDKIQPGTYKGKCSNCGLEITKSFCEGNGFAEIEQNILYEINEVKCTADFSSHGTSWKKLPEYIFNFRVALEKVYECPECGGSINLEKVTDPSCDIQK